MLTHSSEHFFCTPKINVSSTFQSSNRCKRETYLDCVLTKQADRRLIRCFSVCRSILEASESDYNLVYAKVHIPRRCAPNRRKGNSTKETSKTANLRRLMADRTFDAKLRTRWLLLYHQSPMTPASVTSPPTRLTSCHCCQTGTPL